MPMRRNGSTRARSTIRSLEDVWWSPPRSVVRQVEQTLTLEAKPGRSAQPIKRRAPAPNDGDIDAPDHAEHPSRHPGAYVDIAGRNRHADDIDLGHGEGERQGDRVIPIGPR